MHMLPHKLVLCCSMALGSKCTIFCQVYIIMSSNQGVKTFVRKKGDELLLKLLFPLGN